MQVCARAFLASGITPHCPPQVGSLPACIPQGQLSPLRITAAASASPPPCSCRGLAIQPPPLVCSRTLTRLWVRRVAAGHSCCRAGRAQPHAGILRALLLPGTLLEPPGWGLPGARIALTAALGVPRELSVPVGTGCWGPAQPPVPCRGRGAVAVLLRQLGGDPQPPRALVPPPALAEPGRALPGEVACGSATAPSPSLASACHRSPPQKPDRG